MSSNDQKPANGAIVPGSLDLGLKDDYGGFFTPLENTKPYIKLAFEGMPGSGKTWTMALLAIALWKRIGSKKPIVSFDSEKAMKFLRHLFDAAGIEVLHKESRSMADLYDTMTMMREQRISDILLIDSITHVWENFLKAYMEKKKNNTSRLDFGDWGIIKPAWRSAFSEPLVQDPYHVFFTGRAGYEYEDSEDPETGKWTSHKSGIKMRAETETAYEPDLLVLMERMEDILDKNQKDIWRQATVLKDRSGIIDGKTFRNPTADDFMPAIDKALIAPVSRARTIEGDAGMLFRTEEDQRAWFRQRDILVEEIEALLVEHWPGQSGDDRQAKVLALKAGFETASWTWIKNQKPELLAQGKARIEAHIAAGKAAAAAALEAQGPSGFHAEDKPNGSASKPAAKKSTKKAGAAA